MHPIPQRWLYALLAACLCLPCQGEPDRPLASQGPVPANSALRVHQSLSSQLHKLAQPPFQDRLPVWTNPRAGDPGVLVRGGVPEGLELVDDQGHPTDRLDPTKGLAIYIHGWTPTGGSIPSFLYPQLWHQHGFNTLIYRWHVRSQAPFWEAQHRAESGQVAEDFLVQFNRLRAILDQGQPGSYDREIRFIGYSLGAYIALDAADKAFYLREPYASLDWANRRLRRVDLLEPAFVDSILRADQVVVGGYQHTRILTTPEVDKPAVGIPSHLRSWGIPVLAFCSSVDRKLAPGLEKSIPTESLGKDWKPTPKPPNIEDQHLQIVPYYFKSIAEPPAPVENTGRRAFSARTPTASLRGQTLVKLVQVAGMNQKDQSGQLFVEQGVSTTRGGVQVDQEPLYPSVTNGSDAGITIPFFQRGY